MAIKKIRINQKTSTGYDIFYPETSADQVVDTVTGKKVNDVLDTLATHTKDNTKHITSDERAKWNGKQNELPIENRRKITFGTREPAGGVDGDIYFQYE